MEVGFVQSSGGREYVPESIEALPMGDRKALYDALEQLEEMPWDDLIASGTVWRMHLKGEELFELIVRAPESSYRVFFVRRRGVYWMLHLIKKKSQRTPPQDIKTALRRSRLIT